MGAGCDGGRRPRIAGARVLGLARRRLVGHADGGVGQHQHRHDHDRRARRQHGSAENRLAA